MSWRLRVLLFLFAAVFSANALAAGYSCSEFVTYSSCNPGYYMTASPDSADCDISQNAGNACLACPDDHTCEGGTECPVLSDVICDEGWWNDDGVCTECPAGSFCPDKVNPYSCPANSFSSGNGEEECEPCTAGKSNGDSVGAVADCTDDCGNKDNVAAWQVPSWIASGAGSYVKDVCLISSCNAAYKLANGDNGSNHCAKCSLADDGAGSCGCDAAKYPKEGACENCIVACEADPEKVYDVCNGETEENCARPCELDDVENSHPDANIYGTFKAGEEDNGCTTDRCNLGYLLVDGKCGKCDAEAGKYCDGASADFKECDMGYYCPGGGPGSGKVCSYGNNDPDVYIGKCKCPAGLTSYESQDHVEDCIIKGGVGGTKFCDKRGCFYLPRDVPY